MVVVETKRNPSPKDENAKHPTFSSSPPCFLALIPLRDGRPYATLSSRTTCWHPRASSPARETGLPSHHHQHHHKNPHSSHHQPSSAFSWTHPSYHYHHHQPPARSPSTPAPPLLLEPPGPQLTPDTLRTGPPPPPASADAARALPGYAGPQGQRPARAPPVEATAAVRCKALADGA